MAAFRTVYQLEAAGTALTNSTAETPLASYTLPANFAQVGSRFKLRIAVRATSTNSTDTLRVRVRIGTASLSGTVIADATAVDVANDDLVTIDLEGIVRSVGASGVCAWSGFATIAGAEGTVTARAGFELDSWDTTAAQIIEATGVWSVASASNSAQAEVFTLDSLVG